MFFQQAGEKTRIEPPESLKNVLNGVLSLKSEVDCRAPKGEIEINQEGFLPGFPGQRYSKIAGQSGDSGTAFGAEKYE
jgi:hypothetical protein